MGGRDMGEKGFIAQQDPQDEPALRHNTVEPRGVMQKNLKALLYIGAVVIVVIAWLSALFRRRRHRLRTSRRLRSPWSRTTQPTTSRHYSNRLPQKEPATSRMPLWPRRPAPVLPHSRPQP